jgi:dolichol kinase
MFDMYINRYLQQFARRRAKKMKNTEFIWIYSIVTWVYIIGSIVLPIMASLEIVLGFIVASIATIIGTAMTRAKSAGRSPWYGLAVLVPVWQVFVLVNLGK